MDTVTRSIGCLLASVTLAHSAGALAQDKQGFPTVEVANKYHLFAPAGTPRPIINVPNKVISAG